MFESVKLQQDVIATPQRRKIEFDYRGVDISSIVDLAKTIVEKARVGSRLSAKESFYLNPTDSLNNLGTFDVEGKSVLTVAGSGDFALQFANSGAKQVEVFDYSLIALLYNEIKLVAASILSVSEFDKFINAWKDRDSHSFFDPIIYNNSIKENLSPQCQAFWDELTKEENMDVLGKATDFASDHGFSIARPGSGRSKFTTFVPEHFTSIDGQSLSNSVNNCEISLKHSDLVSMIKSLEMGASPPDIAYISNIGFGIDRSLAYASKLKKLGVGRVIFTDNTCDAKLMDDGKTYNVYGFLVQIGGEFAVRFVSEISENAVSKYGFVNKDFWKTGKIKLLGVDSNLTVGVAYEFMGDTEV
ncbi:MAG: DUF3419 family protein [Patescibacteria group bacterium]